jgi:hypothetical protein
MHCRYSLLTLIAQTLALICLSFLQRKQAAATMRRVSMATSSTANSGGSGGAAGAKPQYRASNLLPTAPSINNAPTGGQTTDVAPVTTGGRRPSIVAISLAPGTGSNTAATGQMSPAQRGSQLTQQSAPQSITVPVAAIDDDTTVEEAAVSNHEVW